MTSSGANSVKTIELLMPYRDEFRAAGLAVTSAEQRSGPCSPKIQTRKTTEEPIATGTSPTGTLLQFTPADGVSTTLLEPVPASEARKPHRGLPWLGKKSSVDVDKTPNVEWRNKEAREKAVFAVGNNVAVGKRHHPIPKPQSRQDRHNLPLGNLQARISTRPRARSAMQSKRNYTRPSLPLPLTIHEELESKPTGSSDKPLPPVPKTIKPPQTHTEVPITSKGGNLPPPDLPCTWDYSVSNASSIERALDSVAHRIDKRASPIREHHTPQARFEPGDHDAPHAKECPCPPASFSRVSKPLHRSSMSGEIVYVVHAKPKVFKPPTRRSSKPQHLSRLPYSSNTSTVSSQKTVQKGLMYGAGRVVYVPGKRLKKDLQSPNDLPLDAPPKAPARSSPDPPAGENIKPLDPVINQLPIVSKKDAALPAASFIAESNSGAADDFFRDVGAFPNIEPKQINDRVILKGLQVAITAAVDDEYNTMLQNKTGLRIRGFLAHLQSIPERMDGVKEPRLGKEMEQ